MEWEQVEGVGRVGLNVFTPAEVVNATELSLDMQRVWRRRGHLPPRTTGRSSFNARELAAISVRQGLARYGVPPSDTMTIGFEAAPIVLYYALLYFSGAAQVKGSFRKHISINENFENDDDIARKLTKSIRTDRFLWANELPAFQFDQDFPRSLHQEIYAGFVGLDLLVVGRELIKRINKPLYIVDVSNG